jgi:thiamine transport system substrate-binding protein
VRDNGESQTEALLDGCYRQTEFAGVLTSAKNKAGAQKFIEFLLSDKFQSQLAESMYVYPVSKTATVPESWQQFAPMASQPVGGELDVNAKRDSWLKAWSDIFAG